MAIEVVGGGTPTPEEIAAIAAALEVLLEGQVAAPPAPSRWRWAGREWRSHGGGPDWRRPAVSTHPSGL